MPSSYCAMSSDGCTREAGADPVDVQPPDRGQQVGAERDVGTAAALQHLEHLRERVGDQVVDVGTAHELAAEAFGCLDVTGEELAVGSDVAPADARDQLGVAGCLHTAEEFSHIRLRRAMSVQET